MIAYKLFRIRSDGSLGSLFINRRARYRDREWMVAETIPTKGYALRAGWHCCEKPNAPHLSTKGRVWRKVCIMDYEQHIRPAKQGGLWYTAQRMKIL